MKLKISVVIIAFASSVLAIDYKEEDNFLQKEVLRGVCNDKLSSYRSPPIKANDVVVHVLDKISGKVFRSKLGLGQSVRIGTIVIRLDRAFVNNSEDTDEVYAHIKIEEKSKIMFNNWMFASSPVNLFVHPIYEVRVEF